MRGKIDDSYQDGGSEGSKTMTVTRMATPRGPIPVIVGTFEAYHGGVGGEGAGNAQRPYTICALIPSYPPAN